jgi:hypothetical protein
LGNARAVSITMQSAAVQSLLDGVRRWLWREQVAGTARLALHASAALMLLAAAAHIVAIPLAIRGLLTTVAVLWVVAMLWAGTRRPRLQTAALWADRHLAGESAYSTLVEARTASPNTPALQWLEQWAVATVPRSQRLLASLRAPARLFRPMVAAVICTALAAIVLTRPDTRTQTDKGTTSSAAPQATARSDAAAAPVARPASTDELAAALRRAQPRSDTDNGSMRAVPAPRDRLGEGRTALTAANNSAGAAGGRKAGDSRDDRADRGTSKASQEPMSLQRRPLAARTSTRDRRADMDTLATFEDERTALGAPPEFFHDRAIGSPRAAAPPPAAHTRDLTPAQAAYVQAWLAIDRGRQ